MSPDAAMRRIDVLLSHVWMVRTFVKHSEEAAGDEELMQIVRVLYDFALALGPARSQQDAEAYLKQCRKKYSKLEQAAEQFAKIQPEVSDHTNFKMAVSSLASAVAEIGEVLDQQAGD